MSKRSRHPSGFYASLLSDDRDQAYSSKYRPRVRPAVMENTWEPAEHLPEERITAFECRVVDRVCADECKERLALLFEKGLKSPLACNESITMKHVLLRSIFPEMLSALCRSPYLAGEEERIRAGFGSYMKQHLTVTGGGCRVDTPVSIKLFLGKSPAFMDDDGRKTASRPVERVQLKFTKN
ncbi:hypothetical protein P5673_033446 [Acropora cervicornis]|uniref:Uncharacterized protein n=1 Tax=Acropora cervicornis TaxID=6130 RepID=A0AAD9UR65_ACRCE|nr:hypothetical protein P5673_033446 [Acropora cervicornis]